MSEHIAVAVDGRAMEIRIGRAERRNAITAAMYAAMAEAIERASGDDAIDVVLIHGGDEVFTAGNDLADFRDAPPLDRDQPVFRFMRAVAHCPKVMVAGVAGLAVGIGTTLLLHCDLVVAGRSARFMLPFVDLGLVPEFASSGLLPAAMGRQRANRHLLLAEPFDAATAEAFGIVSQVVDDAEVLTAARDYVQRLLAKPPQALARTKGLLAPDSAATAALIAREADAFAQALKGDEFAEAAAAFFEKRKPVFRKS